MRSLPQKERPFARTATSMLATGLGPVIPGERGRRGSSGIASGLEGTDGRDGSAERDLRVHPVQGQGQQGWNSWSSLSCRPRSWRTSSPSSGIASSSRARRKGERGVHCTLVVVIKPQDGAPRRGLLSKSRGKISGIFSIVDQSNLPRGRLTCPYQI